MVRWVVGSVQPVLHDLYNKGCRMCYPVCGIMHIKEPLLLIGKSIPCGGSRFPLAILPQSYISLLVGRGGGWGVKVCMPSHVTGMWNGGESLTCYDVHLDASEVRLRAQENGRDDISRWKFYCLVVRIETDHVTRNLQETKNGRTIWNKSRTLLSKMIFLE